MRPGDVTLKLSGALSRADPERATVPDGEATALLRAVFDALPDPVIITDDHHRVVLCNRRADELFARDEGDPPGRRRALEINATLLGAHLGRQRQGEEGPGAPRELNLVDPLTGSDLLFEVMTHPLRTDLLPRGLRLSALRDVTDLKQASLELERQFELLRQAEADSSRERDRLNLILDSVADPILVTDEEARILLMNAPAERLFDRALRNPRTRQGQRVRANGAQFTALVTDFATSAARQRHERLVLTDPDTGSELPVEIIAGKIRNERNETQAIVSVLHDLTQQVENERLYHQLKTFSAELEDRIRIATRNLETQNRRLQWQSSELEKASRLKSEFLASMSHELRTPLNALLGYASLVKDRVYGDLTPEQEQALGRIAASSQHLLVLINDILDLSRIESGKMPLHLEEASLHAIVEGAAAELEPLARAKGLHYELCVADDVPLLVTDRTKVHQVLVNLLSNAVKFTHEGRVELRAVREGGSVVVTVSDTGIGIREEDLEVIFEEFRQADQSRTREYPGTGLGLSITRKLLGLLGGEIRVTSRHGEGTTFAVRIPLRSGGTRGAS